MALAVVAVFIDLQEAHIAAGALRSAGFRAEVFDSEYGALDWVVQAALGGFRVAVPEAEAGEALALLQHLRDTAPPRLRPASTGSTLRAGAALGVLALFGGVYGLFVDQLAWLFARRRPLSKPEWMGVGLASVLASVAGVAIFLAGLLLINLLLNPP